MIMKRIICGLMAAGLLGISSVVFAQGDIDNVEVRPDVAKWKLDTVLFLVASQTAKIVYSKVDSTGASVGEEKVVIFRNSEESNEFNQLIQLINNNSNIKQSITAAVKTKLGLP